MKRQAKTRKIATLGLLMTILVAGLGTRLLTGHAARGSLQPAQLTEATKGIDPTVYLDQGWGESDRRRFYDTSQGSRMIPYRWLLALEQPGLVELLMSPRNLERLRFVMEIGRDPKENHAGLPIGFVKDEGAAMPSPDPDIIRELIDKDYDPKTFPRTTTWVGFTCAACHTTRIDAGGKILRVDGGPAMVDMQSFLTDVNRSMQKTLGDDEKKARFARRVLPEGADGESTAALLAELSTFSKLFDFGVKSNAVPEAKRYGFARLDAFGSIFNRVCNVGLGIAENKRPSDAPVSYPPLWDTPSLDWVQTNGSSSSPIGRNMGEVLGVFAEFQLTPRDTLRFQSSGRLPEIFLLEEWIKTLKAPRWPAELGPEFEIDRKRASAGESLFKANCVSCHALRDPEGRFPANPDMVTRPDAAVIRTHTVPLAEIGTDPKFIENFSILVKPGVFADQPGVDHRPAVSRALLLVTASRNIIARKMIEGGLKPGTPEFTARLDEMNSFHKVGVPPPLGGQGYRARPLNGAWATAPFLHNGSVPNLDQLLQPAAARTKSFHVGSRRFDPRRVGFESSPGEGTFEFRTLDDAGNAIPGNSNAGHSGHHYTQTIGEDGEFRDFNDEERSQVIEFLKTLR